MIIELKITDEQKKTLVKARYSVDEVIEILTPDYGEYDEILADPQNKLNRESTESDDWWYSEAVKNGNFEDCWMLDISTTEDFYQLEDWMKILATGG
jgi:hypothetical protein